MSSSDLYMGGNKTGGSPQVKNYPSLTNNYLVSFLWLGCGIAAILIPVIIRSLKMRNYQKMYRMYNWEEAQQQYQQEQQDYYENYQQQYSQGNNGQYQYQYEQQQMSGTYDVHQCKWYQYNCIPYFIDSDGEPQPEAGWYPGWFSGWTVTSEQREQMMEDGETSGALKFVYVWQMLMFLVIIAYGFIVIKQNRVVTGVSVALVAFTNMCFLSMWILADNSIITDGDLVQRTGFYGQFAVLMFITNAWYVLFGIVFSVIFVIRGHIMHSNNDDDDADAPGMKVQRQDESNNNNNSQSTQSYRPLEGDSPTPQRQPITAPPPLV